MRRAVAMKRSGSWTGETAGSVTLPFEDRHRRRIRMTDDSGEQFLLDLADAVRLTDGDALVLEGGGVIVVRAALERVADLRCDDATDALRLAWHIGNRHTPVQVLADGALRIAQDHVLVAMAKGLGAEVLERIAPFQPEGGAYASGHGHDR
jgi:urease accessory protein